MQNYPWLVDDNTAELNSVGGTDKKPPKTFMCLDVTRVGQALLDHQKDSPFAVTDLATVIKEELQQKQNPARLLNDLKSDSAEVKELKNDNVDPDEIAEAEGDLNETVQILQDCLEGNPAQILAVKSLLQDDNFKLAVTAFMEKYGNEERIVKDTPTGKTHKAYLDGVLEEITTSVQEGTKQLRECLPQLQENQDLLAEHGIKVPEEKLEQVIGITQ